VVGKEELIYAVQYRKIEFQVVFESPRREELFGKGEQVAGGLEPMWERS
jgi:hypothetical protein